MSQIRLRHGPALIDNYSWSFCVSLPRVEGHFSETIARQGQIRRREVAHAGPDRADEQRRRQARGDRHPGPGAANLTQTLDDTVLHAGRRPRLGEELSQALVEPTPLRQ